MEALRELDSVGLVRLEEVDEEARRAIDRVETDKGRRDWPRVERGSMLISIVGGDGK